MVRQWSLLFISAQVFSGCQGASPDEVFSSTGGFDDGLLDFCRPAADAHCESHCVKAGFGECPAPEPSGCDADGGCDPDASTELCAKDGYCKPEYEPCSPDDEDCPELCSKSGDEYCEPEPEYTPCSKSGDGYCEPEYTPCPKEGGGAHCELDPCKVDPDSCLAESQGCTLTQGFWKNHPEVWPIDALTIAGVTYSKEALLALLQTPPQGGNAVLILLQQYIAAALNAAGHADTSAIDATAANALAWFAANIVDLPGHVHAGSAEGNYATALAQTLADYNEGHVGPGHCDDANDGGHVY